MEHYEIRKQCISDLIINNHKHAKRNCEVLWFSKVKYIREVPRYRLRYRILVDQEFCVLTVGRSDTVVFCLKPFVLDCWCYTYATG